MPQPTWREVVFSIKTFGAAMLALYIAFTLSLTQPGWAMLTVFVVSQPIAGMVAAKSLYRAVGTVVGAIVALFLVGLFTQNGPVFLVALALWIGACTFTSVLLRDAPASYGAVLSGYTAAIVGIPAALAPDTAFDYAIGRCIEILLGIGCATIVSQVIFPKTAGTALKDSVDTTLTVLARWIGGVLRGESQDDRILADQRRMIADVIALDALRVFATFDTPPIRAAGNVARHLQGQLLNMLSLLGSIHDRMTLLRGFTAGKRESLQPLLSRVADLLDQGDPLRPESDLDATIDALQAEMTSRLPSFSDMVRDHETILVRNILLRLRDVLGTWRRILVLRDGLFSGRSVPTNEPAPTGARYRDLTLAVVAGAISTLAVLATSAFWIASGWPQGSSAVIFSGVICSILASLDDPAAAATNFLMMTFYSAVAAAIYAFTIFPHIDDFASLIMVLSLFYIPFGILLALPRIGTQVAPLGLNFVALLSLTNTNTPVDFASFLNTTLALLAGIASGILMFRLLRPLSVDWTIRRIRRSALRDLQIIADPGTSVDRVRFASRMLDRINALFTRLDVSDPGHQDMMRGTLAGLRIGLNIVTLKRARNGLPGETPNSIDKALTALSRHFRNLKNGQAAGTSLPEIDQAVSALLDHESKDAEEALPAFVAIASALRRHSGFFNVVQSPLFPKALRPKAAA